MKKNFLLIFLSLFLLVFLAGAGSYYLKKSKNPSPKIPSEKDKGFADLVELVTPPGPLPIVVIDEHPEYWTETNPSFSFEKQQMLLEKYQKEKITFHLVGSEDQVPWDGALQKGKDWDQEKNLPMNTMMAIYKEKQVEYYFYPHSEYYQQYGEKKLEVLSRVISYKLIEALAASDRDYLVNAQPAPKIPPQIINEYCQDNPLIIVREKK